jgi:iron(III) transport system substrate-binding protein
VRRALGLVAAVAALLPMSACGGSDPDLVVYSGRSEPLFKPILEEFNEQTGLKVSVRFADTTDLAATLIEEGDKPRADVFVGQDAGALARLDERRLLAPYRSRALDAVPPRYRSPDATWTGLSARARVLIVNTEELGPAERPRSIFELTEPKWRGKVAAPNTTNASWIGFVSALRLTEGEERARDWLEGMKRNDLAVLGSHTDVRNAVGSGEFAVGLVNHYYVELERREGTPVEAVFTDQQAGGLGTVINTASGGIVRNAPHPANARRLMDFLLSEKIQRELAGRNYEYPVVPGVPAPGLRRLSELRVSEVPLADLGPEVDRTLALLREVGLGE